MESCVITGLRSESQRAHPEKTQSRNPDNIQQKRRQIVLKIVKHASPKIIKIVADPRSKSDAYR